MVRFIQLGKRISILRLRRFKALIWPLVTNHFTLLWKQSARRNESGTHKSNPHLINSQTSVLFTLRSPTRILLFSFHFCLHFFYYDCNASQFCFTATVSPNEHFVFFILVPISGLRVITKIIELCEVVNCFTLRMWTSPFVSFLLLNSLVCLSGVIHPSLPFEYWIVLEFMVVWFFFLLFLFSYIFYISCFCFLWGSGC